MRSRSTAMTVHARIPVTSRHVVFSHGKESGPWGRKITALAEVARAEGYEAHSVDYRGIEEPRARVAQAGGLLQGAQRRSGAGRLEPRRATWRWPRPRCCTPAACSSWRRRCTCEGLPELRAGVLDCSDEHRARLARRGRAVRAQRALRAELQGGAAPARERSPPAQPAARHPVPVRVLPHRARPAARSPSSERQRRSRMARAASWSTSPGTISRAQRAKRPRAEVISRRWRRRMAPAMSAAHCLRRHDAASPASACAPAAGHPAPMARRWISLTTKSGATMVTSTPLPLQLDAQRLEETDHGVLAGRVAGALGHAGEPCDAGDGHHQAARRLQVRQRRGGDAHRAQIVDRQQALVYREVS